jgi:acetyl esterase
MNVSVHEEAPRAPGLDRAVTELLDSLEASADRTGMAQSLDTLRASIHDVEGAGTELPAVSAEELEIPGTVAGQVRLRIVRPPNVRGWLPGVVYLHGGGWVLGDVETHDWVVRSLAVDAACAVVFVDYHRSPEAPFPIALEEAYATLAWLADHGGSVGVDGQRLGVAGDSAGGNMATVVCMLAKERGGPRIAHQVLFYPTTDLEHEYESFQAYASGYYLTADSLRWSREQYAPDPTHWAQPTLSPVRATSEALSGMPPALVITAEHDPLRDEAEAYARRLTQAGVPTVAVRYLGTIHAFLTLRALARTPAPRSAIAQAAFELTRAFSGTRRHVTQSTSRLTASGLAASAATTGAQARAAGSAATIMEGS